MTRKTVASPVVVPTGVSGEGTFEIIFSIPVNQMGVSADGDYFNLPYHVKGNMKHGKTNVEVYISKGRVIVPTSKGRKTKTPKATARPTVDVSKLL